MEMFIQSTSDYAGLPGAYMYILAAISGAILASAYLMIIFYTLADLFASASKLTRKFKSPGQANHIGKMHKPVALRHALAGGKH